MQEKKQNSVAVSVKRSHLFIALKIIVALILFFLIPSMYFIWKVMLS